MKLNHERLKSKGWTDEEIEQTRQILLEAEEKKHPRHIMLEKAIYWIVLGVILIGAIASAWLMEPIMLATTPTQAAVFVGIFGVLFGVLASILIKDIEELEVHHHLIISAIIPVVAIGASVIISKRVKLIQEALGLAGGHHPLLLAGVFAVGAILPYIIFISTQRN